MTSFQPALNPGATSALRHMSNFTLHILTIRGLKTKLILWVIAREKRNTARSANSCLFRRFAHYGRAVTAVIYAKLAEQKVLSRLVPQYHIMNIPHERTRGVLSCSQCNYRLERNRTKFRRTTSPRIKLYALRWRFVCWLHTCVTFF